MTMQRVRAALRGVSGIHVTPFSVDGTPNYAMLGKVVRRISVAGVQNVVSCGNTGEFYSLTGDEVVRIQAVALAAVERGALRTAAVGRSLAEALITGALAQTAGAEALMIHHPTDPFAAPSAQADYFIAIAEASKVPVMAYLRSDTLPLSDIRRIAAHANMAGIKFASTNLMHLAECIRSTADLPCVWVCGLAEGWAPPHYAVGARGFTSGLVNVAPERSMAIWQALDSADYEAARRLIDPIAGFEKLRTRHANGANVTVVKEALSLTGWEVGDVRLPGLPRLDVQDRAELKALLPLLAMS